MGEKNLTGGEATYRDFDRFFRQATGHEGPFDYQQKLALWKVGEELPQLLDVPTGAGKTAGVWRGCGGGASPMKPHGRPRRAGSFTACRCGCSVPKKLIVKGGNVICLIKPKPQNWTMKH